jgi:thiamine monophosphate synthase
LLYSAKLQINTSAELFQELALKQSHIGLHLNTENLMRLQERPIAKNILLSASCHSQIEIHHAQKIGVDFICLSPVLPTSSHPDAKILGWEKFSQLVAGTTIPVFALGGMREENLQHAIAMGAHGISGISEWWQISNSTKF